MTKQNLKQPKENTYTFTPFYTVDEFFICEMIYNIFVQYL